MLDKGLTRGDAFVVDGCCPIKVCRIYLVLTIEPYIFRHRSVSVDKVIETCRDPNDMITQLEDHKNQEGKDHSSHERPVPIPESIFRHFIATLLTGMETLHQVIPIYMIAVRPCTHDDNSFF